MSWPTVAVSATLSAGVSALVALAADYFARPGLEARKERIMERYRARRFFATELLRVQVAASMMCSGPPPDLNSSDRQKYDAEMKRQRDVVIAATDAMQDSLLSFALSLSPRLHAPVARYVGHACGIGLSISPTPMPVRNFS